MKSIFRLIFHRVLPFESRNWGLCKTKLRKECNLLEVSAG